MIGIVYEEAISDEDVINEEVLEGRSLEWLGDLGKGAFGKVIKVRHLTDNLEYALKVMRRSSKEREKVLKYQTRELKLLTEQVISPITHKNIVKYYDSWEYTEAPGEPFLCIRMELCDTNLEHLLQEKKDVVDNPLFYRHVLLQILSGLEYLHDEIHWVHRDIYPPNILLSSCEQGLPYSVVDVSLLVVKLADFGLARKLVDDHDQLYLSDPPDEVLSVVGNRLYQAPEMSSGDYDYKVDLYSAGVVLFRLCYYFNSMSCIMSELESIRNSGTVNKNMLCHHDPLLNQLLDDLLNKDPKKRPSASEAQTLFSIPSPALPDTQASGSLPLTETDGLKQPRQVKVLAKKKSDSSYVRMYDLKPSDGSFDELCEHLKKELKVSGIESVVEEKCKEKVRNSRDWNAILQSAEKDDCSAVNLVVEPAAMGSGDEDEPDLC